MNLTRKSFLLAPFAPLAVWLGWKISPRPQDREDKSPWVPVCWCGLSGDDVTEVGDSGAGTLYKCMNRHSFFAPWEKDKP
jgi:hypothetical protein